MIAKKLQNLKPDKAAGPDNIFPRILIECQYDMSYSPLYLLFKESLKTGKIPQQWKDATVVAIFKKGSNLLSVTLELHPPTILFVIISGYNVPLRLL